MPAPSNSHRCPVCDKLVDVASLAYSESAGTFVCPACRVAAAAAGLGSAPTPPPAPTPSEPIEVKQPKRTPAVAHPLPWIISIGLVAVLCIAAVVVVLVKRPADDDRRAWEDANRDKIIALKSEAEELVIADKLPEAHAKYRELEKLVGGRTIQDPRLFDLVDQARLDQSRVYAMIMHTMAPEVIAPNNGLPASVPAQQQPQAQPQQAVVTTEPTGAAESSQAYAPPAPTVQQREERAQRWMAQVSAPASAPASASASARASGPAPAPASSPASASPSQASADSSAKGQATSAPPAAGAAATSPSEVAVGSAPPPGATATTTNEPVAPIGSSAANVPVATVAAAAQGGVGITDAQLERALMQGADFLLSQFDRNGELRRYPEESEVEHEGLDALALYALLQASKAVNHPKLGIHGEMLPPAIAKLKSFPITVGGEIGPPATYTHSLRASALATYNRAEDHEALAGDVRWLISAAVDGAYTYDDRDSRGGGGGGARGPRGPRSRRHVRPGEIGADAVAALDLWRSDDAPVRLIHNGEILPPPGPPMPPIVPTVPRFAPPPRTYHPQGPTYGNAPRLGRRYPQQQEYTTPFFWDNSNSQYGVLGVWAGAEVGIEVPDKYWKAVRQHWTECQLPSGQWSYMPGTEATYSMTCGGVASLLICHDYLDAPTLGAKIANAQKPYDDALTAGLAFLEDGDNVVNFLQTAPNNLLFAGYNLFGLERVGLASGLKYFGSHDWFVELCQKILPTQWPSGAWGRVDQGRQAVIDTSYILLFLSRGRHPIMMNKLRFDGPWTNRPRDVANLAAYAGREMERPVNWQAVDLSRTPDDWADSPILYLASNRALELAPEDLAKLKQFADAGGLLFTHADQSSGTFNTWAAGLAKTLWPQYALADLPAEHPIYSLNFKLPKPHPRLQGVFNGARLLMIHSPTDLAGAWQQRAYVSRKDVFQLGVNLYVYTTGKERFRNRLDTRAVPDPPRVPAPTIDVAELQYDGNWDPEPAAWPRFAKVFENATGTRIVVQTAKAGEVDANKFLIVLITGIGPNVPADADLTPLRKFLDDGGTILIDACGGSGTFASAMEAWVAKLVPDTNGMLAPIPPEDPLMKDLPPKALRLYALEQLRNDAPRLKQMTIGKGRIVFSALDIRSGLLGTNTWGVLGYLPEYSEALMKNFVLLTSKRDQAR